jgi:Strictosidine synthase
MVKRKSSKQARGGRDIVFSTDQKKSYRHFLLGIFAAYASFNVFKPILLPWGAASSESPIKYASVDLKNTLLQNKAKKIYPAPPVRGPETVIFDSKNRMYVVTEDAKLYEIRDYKGTSSTGSTGTEIINATSVFLKDLGMGRPLGGRFAGETLYLADSLLGLIRIHNVHDKKSKVELVVSSVDQQRILYADDVIVGPKTGKVYFTDASEIAPDRIRVGVDSSTTWDTLHASKLDLMSGRATGRLLQYDPKSDQTIVLAKQLRFPNGIGIDPTETSLIFAETFGIRLTKYDLETGELKTVIDSEDLPGYLDGVDCGAQKCYAVMPSAIVPAHKILNVLPIAVSAFLRSLLMSLPKALVPPVKKFGGIIEYNMQDGTHRAFLDPSGKSISMLTGATLHNNLLYLGSLQNEYIGVFDPSDVV